VYAATGEKKDPARKIASPRNAYRCKDGRWVALSGSTDAMARRVFEAMGRPELVDDPRFATNEARLANDAELDRMIADAVQKMNLDECLALFRQKGVTLGPIYDAPQLLSDRHVVQRECYVALETDDGPAVMHNITPRLSRTPGAIRRPAPGLGQHTGELLREAGVDDAEIQTMRERGAIRCL
jgi:crotonobetainyl-CoA:carnitine CoA-transferase CaiB-like acyl-CoA transferase